MTIVLDAGALVAVERRNKKVVARLSKALDQGQRVLTHAGVVGQVWRGGDGRQALLARYLRSVDVVPIDEEMGKRAGMLLG